MESFAKSPEKKAARLAQGLEPQQPRIQEGLAQLKASHLFIEDLFEQYSSLAHPVKKQLCLMALCERLSVHISLLIHWFYPAVLDVLGDTEEVSTKIILRYVQFKQLIAELESLPPHSDLCEKKVDVLKAYFQFHVREEETVTFPRLRKSNLNLLALGKILHSARQQIEQHLVQRSVLTSFNGEKKFIAPAAGSLLRH